MGKIFSEKIEKDMQLKDNETYWVVTGGINALAVYTRSLGDTPDRWYLVKQRRFADAAEVEMVLNTPVLNPVSWANLQNKIMSVMAALEVHKSFLKTKVTSLTNELGTSEKTNSFQTGKLIGYLHAKLELGYSTDKMEDLMDSVNKYK